MRALVVLLALVGASIATTLAPLPCTVGTMPDADFASLTDALANCKPDATGEVTLQLFGEFAAEDLDFDLLTTAEYVTIEAYRAGTQTAKFHGAARASGIPPQIKAVTLNDLYFDFEGQNCSLWHSALKAGLTIDNCTFRNGSHGPLLKVDGGRFRLTRSHFDNLGEPIFHSPSVDQISDLVSKDNDGDSLSILITDQEDPFVEMDNKKPAYPHPDSDYAKLQKGIGHPDEFDKALMNAGKATPNDHHRPKLTDELLDLIESVTAVAQKTASQVETAVCEAQSKLLIDSAIEDTRSPWSDRGGALYRFFRANPVCRDNEAYCIDIYTAALSLEKLRMKHPCLTAHTWSEEDAVKMA